MKRKFVSPQSYNRKVRLGKEKVIRFPFTYIIVRSNTPPSIQAERMWNVAENTPVGARVSQIRGLDADNNPLTFFIGNPTLLPGMRFVDGTAFFRVDARTGSVHLKQSLSGMRGQRLMIAVGVNDGVYNAKMDIVVQVTASDGSELPPPNNRFNPVTLPPGSSGIIAPPPLNIPPSGAAPARPPTPPLSPSGSSPDNVDFSKLSLSNTVFTLRV